MGGEVRRLLLVGGLVLVVSLVLYLPAANVIGWTGLDRRVALQGVTGTMWSGGASAARVDVGDGGAPGDSLYLGAVRWRFNLWSLFLGRLEYAFAADGGPAFSGVRGRVSPAGDGVRLMETRGSARLEAVAPILALPTLSGMSGTVDFDLTHVVLTGADGGGWPRRANGNLVLRNVSVALLPGTLGDYEITFRDEAGSDNVLVTYRDLSNGPLAIEGTATLRPDGTFERQCTASVRAGASPMLAQAVPMLCSDALF